MSEENALARSLSGAVGRQYETDGGSPQTAIAAVNQQERVMIESRLMIALRVGRNWDQIELHINKMLLDPDFATEALYVKPIGGRKPDGYDEMDKRTQLVKADAKWPRGFSIRAVEAFIAEAGHFDVSSTIIFEDEEKLITNMTVFDLCSNNVERRMVITSKIIERRDLKKGQQHIGTRQNSYGDTLYLVFGTPSDIETTRNAELSKAKRTLAEKMIPAGIRRRWRQTAEATIRDDMQKDPDGKKRELLQSFFRLGVEPKQLEEFLEHSLDVLTPAEFVILRGIYMAIAAGEAAWKDVMATKTPDDEREEGKAQSRGEQSIATRIKAKPAEKTAEPTDKQTETKQTEEQPGEPGEEKKSANKSDPFAGVGSQK